jgi:hypothetical protein
MARIGAALGAAIFVTIAGNAHATGEIVCEAAGGGEASVFLTIGHLPVLAVVNGGVEAFDKRWALNPENGETPIAVGQGCADGERTVIDFVDPNYEGVVLSLRLEQALEADSFAQAGVLKVTGLGAVPMVCMEP